MNQDEEPNQDEELLAELREAERTSSNRRACRACDAVGSVSGEARSALIAALGGTIGGERLAKILQNNGHDVSYRQIRKHREEGHAS